MGIASPSAAGTGRWRIGVGGLLQLTGMRPDLGGVMATDREIALEQALIALIGC